MQTKDSLGPARTGNYTCRSPHPESDNYATNTSTFNHETHTEEEACNPIFTYAETTADGEKEEYGLLEIKTKSKHKPLPSKWGVQRRETPAPPLRPETAVSCSVAPLRST